MYIVLCREIPAELQKLVHGNQVSLDMEDHRSEDYLKHKLKFKAFSGDGHKLGRSGISICGFLVHFVDLTFLQSFGRLSQS